MILLLSCQNNIHCTRLASIVVKHNNVMSPEGEAGISGTNICNPNNINHSQLLTYECFPLFEVFQDLFHRRSCRRMFPRDKSLDDSVDRQCGRKDS